jgi:hypothetical protein
MPGNVHHVADRRTAPDAHVAPTMLRRQLTLLFSRHQAEDVILVRVLCEHYHHAAMTAKSGHPDAARRQLGDLAGGVPVPSHIELRSVVEVAAQPVWALVSWLTGTHDRARGQLLDALDACAELSGTWGHDYLTGRQLHLGVNMARVAITAGDHAGARSLLADLSAAVDGDPSRWPFAGAPSLQVPLTGLERLAMTGQLDRAAQRLAGAAG